MLRRRLQNGILLRAKRNSGVKTVQVKHGGFVDPWFSDTEYTNYRYAMTKDVPLFPHYDKMKEPFFGKVRPIENNTWAKMKHRRGHLQREFVQYSRAHNGHAPKPVWLLSRSDAGLRGGSWAGAPAKPVWKPPGKGQRVVMKATFEPEIPPEEFMEEYTRVNNNYKDDMRGIMKFLFLRYTEPIIAEEEAFAQIVVLMWKFKKEIYEKTNPDEKMDFLEKLTKDNKLTALPVRHRPFVNWYRYMDQPEANGQGRGYKLVQHVMLIILEKSNWALLDRLAEYNFDALDLKNFDSLEKRINYNEDRNKWKKENVHHKLDNLAEMSWEEDMLQGEAIEYKLYEDDIKRGEKFDELVEESEHFLYPDTMAEQIMSSIENPITANFSIDDHGHPQKPKLFTSEDNFRITQLEDEYVKREQLRLDGVLRTVEDEEEYMLEQFQEADREARLFYEKEIERAKLERESYSDETDDSDEWSQIN